MLAYNGSLVAGWNLHFPTNMERTLWRIASLCSIAFCLVYGLFGIWADVVHFGPRNQQKPTVRLNDPGRVDSEGGQIAEITESAAESLGWKDKRIRHLAMVLRNSSPDADPMLNMPMHILLPSVTLCGIYCIARAYILIEDVIGLRSLPASCFEQVDWWQFMPHF